MKLNREIVIVDGARTPYGKFGGGLKNFSATDLGVLAARAALERAKVAPDQVDHVLFGNVLQTSADAIYLARHVGLKADVPKEVPALTVNRLCGSGFEAVVQGAMRILLGEAEVCLVGGTESMSQAAHVIRGARWGLPLGSAPMEDQLWASLTDSYCDRAMAITAETLAERNGVNRADSDALALQSQQRATDAIGAGRLAHEIVPVEVPSRKGTKVIDADEHPRAEATAEALAGLRPYFSKEGVVTAGNASGICDGAVALVLASRERADALGLRPLGRLVSWGTAGVDPEIMGIGPVPASRQALERAGLSIDAMDLVEINEAFAAQAVVCERELGVDRAKLNVNGGAVALGHPLGSTGARLALTALKELGRRGGRYGLVTMCIGGGQGISGVIERI